MQKPLAVACFAGGHVHVHGASQLVTLGRAFGKACAVSNEECLQLNAALDPLLELLLLDFLQHAVRCTAFAPVQHQGSSGPATNASAKA